MVSPLFYQLFFPLASLLKKFVQKKTKPKADTASTWRPSLLSVFVLMSSSLLPRWSRLFCTLRRGGSATARARPRGYYVVLPSGPGVLFRRWCRHDYLWGFIFEGLWWLGWDGFDWGGSGHWGGGILFMEYCILVVGPLTLSTDHDWTMETDRLINNSQFGINLSQWKSNVFTKHVTICGVRGTTRKKKPEKFSLLKRQTD